MGKKSDVSLQTLAEFWVDQYYDCLETDVREDARKNFKRQPYKSVDVAQYIAKKFGIGGDADGRRTENHE